MAPPGHFSEGCIRAGERGIEAMRTVLDNLASLEERLAATSPAEQRVVSAAMRDQLRAALHHPSLYRMWSGPMHSPADLLGRTPGPVLLARLPATGVSHPDALAARSYGSYLLSCVLAAASWRQRSGAVGEWDIAGPPVLVVLQDASTWLSGNGSNPLSAHMDVLGRAGIALLMAGAKLPEGTEGEWLLDNTGTWWVHSLASSDAMAVRRRLQKLGMAADVPLTAMPDGVCLLKLPGSDSPVVATAYTGAAGALMEVRKEYAQSAHQPRQERGSLWRPTNT